MSRSILHTLFALAILALGIVSMTLLELTRPGLAERDRSQTPLRVGVAPAWRPETAPVLELHGRLQPREVLPLSMEVAGRIRDLHPELRSGGRIPADAILLRVDQEDLRTALVQARSQEAEVAVVLAQERATAERALADWQALGSEGEAGDLLRRRPQLAAAEARLAAAQAVRERAERDLGRASLVAPWPARVLSEQVAVGQQVTPGMQLAELAPADRGEIRVPVGDAEAAILALPLGAELPLSAAEGRALALARVQRWEAQRLPGTGQRVLVLSCPLDELVVAGRALPFGSPVRIHAPVAVEADWLEVPERALRGGRAVVVLRDGLLHEVAVAVHWRRADSALVSGVLQEGEPLCISPLPEVVDGLAAIAAPDGPAPIAVPPPVDLP